MARVVVHAHRPRDPYVRVARRILEDPGLSWKAKSIHAHLMDRGTHPGGFETTIEDLVALGTEKAYAVRMALDELEAVELLRRDDSGKGGRGRHAVWLVTDEPGMFGTAETPRKSRASTGPMPAISATETRENRDPHLLIQPSILIASNDAGPTASQPKTQRARNPLWDALEREVSPARTKMECTIRGATIKELKAAMPEIQPADIIERCAQWRARYPRATLTDMALRKSWSSLAPPPRKTRERIADPHVRSLLQAAGEDVC